MAGEATIGAIRVVLGADTAKFEENLKGAVDSLQHFGKDVLKIATGINLASIFQQAAEGIKSSIEQAIEAGDKLSKASDKFGIPVSTLHALSTAASLSDVSLEQLGGSLSKLSKNMIAAQGATSEQATAFKALGIATKDASGQFKSTDELLLEIADSFSKFRDGATKTALAVALFGRAGADMIPFLNQGRAGIEEMTKRLQDLGLVIDTQTAKAAEKLTDDIQFLSKAKEALILKVAGTSGLIEALDKLVVSMTNETSIGGQLSQIFYDIARGLTNFVTVLSGAIELLNTFADSLNKINEAAGLLAKGEFAEASEVIQQSIEGATGALGKFAERVGETVPTASEGIGALTHGITGLGEASQKASAAPPPFDPEGAKKAEAFRKEIDRLNGAAIDASGLFAGRLAPGFLAAAAGMEILKGQVKLGADGVATLGLKAEQLNQALLRVQGAKILQDQLPVWDEFNQKLVASDAALRAFGATDAQVLANHVKLSGEAVAATGQFFSFLQQGAAAAGEHNKAFAFAAKQLAVAQALINTYEAATKAFTLFGGWPLGAAAAAATVAAGLALVAKIEATPLAKGGSFKVPGGISGIDKQMVPLALAPGERVDVTPAGQVRDSGGSSRVIELSGIGPRDLFTGTMLRDLVEALNAGHRDGYRLKLGER